MLFPPPGKGVPGGPADARTLQPSLLLLSSFLPQPHVRKVKSSTLAACPWLPARRSALQEKWSFPFFSHVHFSSMCCRGGTSCSLNIGTAGVGIAARHRLTEALERHTFTSVQALSHRVYCIIGNREMSDGERVGLAVVLSRNDLIPFMSFRFWYRNFVYWPIRIVLTQDRCIEKIYVNISFLFSNICILLILYRCYVIELLDITQATLPFMDIGYLCSKKSFKLQTGVQQAAGK